jgi:hypothetical protein
MNTFTYGAEPFLRSRQLCSPSRTPQDYIVMYIAALFLGVLLKHLDTTLVLQEALFLATPIPYFYQHYNITLRRA